MRVTFVNPAGGLGGSERSLLDAMVSLRAVRPDLAANLLVLEDGELAHAARAEGIETAVEPLPPALRRLGEAGRGSAPGLGDFVRAFVATPGYVTRLARRLKSLRPELVHTNGMKAHLLMATAFRRYPLVVHLRDFLSERPLGRHLVRVLPERAFVVANSRAVRDDLLRLAAHVPSRVVYNAVDTVAFRPGPADPNWLASRSGLGDPAPGTLSVGLVATYAWWKGHFDFIAAAARIRSRLAGLPLRFYLVGGPIYATRGADWSPGEIRRAVAEQGLDDVLGLVPFERDPAPVYRALDVVVHASTRPEPFGRTIVEAMASERAVVVARAGGAVELFEEGRSALGFTPGDPEDMARVVIRLLTDAELRRRLAAEARRTAVERFHRDRLGPELLDVYATLLGRR